MTDPKPPQRTVIPAVPGSRLAELKARYDALKPMADEAAQHLQEVKDAIKVELAQAAPDSEDITLQDPNGGLRLRAKTSMRFDSTRFKKDDPLTYVKYAKPSTSWELRAE